MNPQPTIDAMSDAAQTLESGDVREKLHAIQQAQDALDGMKAVLLAELHVSKAHEIDGASTLNAWVRNQLRMSSKQASVLVRNSAALNDLALVAESALSGRINAAHVQAFVYGIKHVGLEVMRQHEKAFVKVAESHDPGKLFEVIKHLKDVIHPDDLDDKWRDGMDKEDFCVDAVPDGWHVSGFLNTVTGAKLKKVIDSLAAPRDKDDDRTGPQRRVQAVDDIASALLDSALPSDKGVRPHMSVFADADTVEAAAQHVKQATEHPFGMTDPMPDVEPATLAGHGHIGPQLLMYFLCISDVTAFLMSEGGGQAQVLNAATSPQAERSEAGARAEPGSDGVAGAARHEPRAPPLHLVLPRRPHRPRPPHRDLLALPPPRPPRPPHHHRQRRHRLHLHHPPRQTTPPQTTNPLPPSRLTPHRPAAHRHAYRQPHDR